MIPSIMLPDRIYVFTERTEIIDFFKEQQFLGIEVLYYKKFALHQEKIRAAFDNSFFIDPKSTDLENPSSDFLHEKYSSEKMHFIMPQEEVLAFLKLTGLSEPVVIPVPCDREVFKRSKKKTFPSGFVCSADEKEISLLSDIAGSSDCMKLLKSKLILASRTELPVLLLGETGTGKSFASSFIHKLSVRGKKCFNELDLGTLSESLADTELFGSAYGAFTGAVNRKGLLLESDGGTLFLDEIANASLSIQIKLLRFVETGKIRAVGSNKEQSVSTRLIFATNADLSHLVKEKLFRADLYNRINVFTIEFEPLRNHPEDIKEITEKLLSEKSCTITKSALSVLESHSWPGNIRELKNCLYRAALVCRNKCITESDISFNQQVFPQNF